ncbi:lysoplasmalogenase [Tumebacillus sp. ITR2]|uniref:Lysoplasmalogenase n=1 Tax=Tumebacillus amylolyticus TaxID=2801339 RepID=A0ABS1J6Y0_9BACL|nr:lysoplasmalogenase [Tumebacillus amylolyticus]MBL0386050.1 lysoplasmalogenase [Tumebacillus amylolyticus]
MWVVTGAAVVSGLVDLFCIAKGWSKARYLWKPGTMVLVIFLAVWGANLSGHEVSASQGWLIAGLLLSLVGDVFLVLPSDRFIAGLASFLLAHFFYIAAFPQAVDAQGSGWWVAGVLVLFGIGYFAVLRRGVLKSGGYGLLAAVVLYILVILAMVWRAWLSGQGLILAGAGFFMVSDSILAWNRFVKPSLLAEVSVMATYFAAQIVLAWSVSLI